MSDREFRSDVLIVGGGVIGLTTALKLAEDGISVVVCDRQNVAQEASWAGAGMLPPGNLPFAKTAEARLRSLSAAEWTGFSRQLLDLTGIDNGYRICGAVEFVSDEDAESQTQQDSWREEQLRVEQIDCVEIERRTGSRNEHFSHALYLPDFAQVRNPRHLKALVAACKQRGVQFVENVGFVRLASKAGRIMEAWGEQAHFAFDKICVAAGSWSAQLLGQLGCRIPVRPVRGQIVLLRNHSQTIPSVVELGRRYIVPRNDGLVLVGSTEEEAGFEKRNTAEGVRQLIELAETLCPALRNAELVRCWSGLRPASADELPLIGFVPGFDNLFVGTGHFRSGLQMSVGTASVLTALIQCRPSPISLEGLQPERFA